MHYLTNNCWSTYKNKRQAYERNNDYTTKNLLDYLYHQNYYKLIGRDLSRQWNSNISQQNNFIE